MPVHAAEPLNHPENETGWLDSIAALVEHNGVFIGIGLLTLAISLTAVMLVIRHAVRSGT
ncbi:hypothetical protein ACN3XK_10100 [Actinomadura welshii]